MSNNNTIIVAIIAIVAIGFLVSESGQVSNLTGDVIKKCIDSDGGREIFTPGTVSYGTDTYRDGCSGNYLSERYCSRNFPSTQKFLCPGSGATCVTTRGGSYCVEVEGQEASAAE